MLVVGALLIAHGLQKAFGLWGGPGFDGFEKSLTDMGFQHADILTYVAAGGQIAAGVLLVLGLFTPVAAAGALAYLVNGHIGRGHDGPRRGQVAVVPHRRPRVQSHPGLRGRGDHPDRPRSLRVDAGRGWARRPFIGSFVALLLGVGGGIAVWVLLNGGNPLA